MEIGGYDLNITAIAPVTNKDIAAEIMDFICWSNGVREDASIDGEQSDDFFWYKNQECLDAWNEGMTDEDTMIYFLFEGTEQLTIVSDKSHNEQIRDFLKDRRIRINNGNR